MLLRNKKTGEILTIGNIIVENPERIDCGELTKCSSLAELNDEWEDYNPKVFYYINENGGVLRYIPSDPEGEDETYMKYQKEIGNYFETREETEKAVEKLKAWKRLKDKGFEFCCDIQNSYDTLGAVKPYDPMNSFDQWLDDEVAIIEQYTGLKDKNGKEIYEGDIVYDIYTGDEVFIVGWDKDKASFMLADTADYPMAYFDEYELDKDLEVIGNVHENKELWDDSEK